MEREGGGVTALDVNIRLYQSMKMTGTHTVHTYPHTQALLPGLWESIWESDHTTTIGRHLFPQLSRKYLPVRKQLVMGSAGEMGSSLRGDGRRGKKEKERRRWRCSGSVYLGYLVKRRETAEERLEPSWSRSLREHRLLLSDCCKLQPVKKWKWPCWLLGMCCIHPLMKHHRLVHSQHP